jgi:hypothetical protein
MGSIDIHIITRQECIRAVKVYFCYTRKFRNTDPDPAFACSCNLSIYTAPHVQYILEADDSYMAAADSVGCACSVLLQMRADEPSRRSPDVPMLLRKSSERRMVRLQVS